MHKLNILFLFAFISCNSNSQPVPHALNGISSFADTTQLNLVHKTIRAFPNETEISIALIRNGQPQFHGVLRLNDTLQSIDNSESVFEIGSITKVFTSTLLANFVLEDQLSLEDNISDYLDFKLKDDIQITFVELSNHTSGLPRMPSNFLIGSLMNPSNPYKTYNEEKLKEYLTDELELKHKKGLKSNYSNLGAGLLGYTLSQVSGQDYQTMSKEKIFDRYGMNQTTLDRSEIESLLVRGLDADGEPTSNWDLAALVGAGGILSSTNDLSKFCLAQFDSTNLELALTRKVSFRDLNGMDLGLGWHIITTKSNNRLHWHNGGTGGYTSSMALDIEKQNAVILLSNVSAFHPDARTIDQLCFGLLKTLDPESPGN